MDWKKKKKREKSYSSRRLLNKKKSLKSLLSCEDLEVELDVLDKPWCNGKVGMKVSNLGMKQKMNGCLERSKYYE